MWSLYRRGRREEAQQLLLPSSWCRWKAEAINVGILDSFLYFFFSILKNTLIKLFVVE